MNYCRGITIYLKGNGKTIRQINFKGFRILLPGYLKYFTVNKLIGWAKFQTKIVVRDGVVLKTL